MGRDKALLPHPEGGSWLERQVRLLAGLGAPVTLLSSWPAHLETAADLGESLRLQGVALELLREPTGEPGRPPAGPLVALARLMEAHPDERLLLCPIDMPALTLSGLQEMLLASAADPASIWIAAPDQPGTPPQPLVGLYPSDANRRRRLGKALAHGERALLRWLAGERTRRHPLPSAQLMNVNTPEDWSVWRAMGDPSGAASPTSPAPGGKS
jgi:molybdopterin-guanine dinucleotide biosynthesis protein A